jgi:hypothetical protein
MASRYGCLQVVSWIAPVTIAFSAQGVHLRLDNIVGTGGGSPHPS